MIKAVIFDCFGVLAESSYNLFYKTHLADRPDIVEQIKALDHASNKGGITFDDFYAGVAELTGMPGHEIREFMRSNHPPNLELFAYISQTLKPKYKIGFLSNVANNLMDELFTDEQQALFDDVVLSYAVKLAKPEVQIFELAAKRLDVDVAECVFVDDLQSYLDGAEIAGMKTILFTDFRNFRRELEMLL